MQDEAELEVPEGELEALEEELEVLEGVAEAEECLAAAGEEQPDIKSRLISSNGRKDNLKVFEKVFIDGSFCGRVMGIIDIYLLWRAELHRTDKPGWH